MKILQGGVISPWTDMSSLYFDDSLAENELHYKIEKYIDEFLNDDEYDELVFKCDNENEFNNMLSSLAKYPEDKIKIFGTTENNMEIIIERDPRDNYRKFDEKYVLDDPDDNEDK